ncbi:hypothetical protein E1265_26670 [Streptomyces sp. 8K308]|uniref:GAP family protein n=1 Tax=Streptomyces sp. 8K308 TaxID=2530388 RepID=UPI00104CEAC7|nr:GAP family protein [Streptomyces sp. 8K308]TDC15485.1 hypothetical protein E1265_26670 [Streptomyces sp. 8K308]
MSLGLLLSLAGLALLDATSVGTLLIPLWLLLSPTRFSAARVLLYLGTLAGCYLALGLAIVLGAEPLLTAVGDSLDGRTALWIQLGIGVGLFALSFYFDPKRVAARGGSTGRWRDRLAHRASAGWMVGLALLAALAEAATMLPYLGAIAMLGTAGLDTAAVTAVLAGYCALMVAPALLLLAGRTLAAARIEPTLKRLGAWLGERAAGATGWILVIAGFLVARDAAARLWFPDAFGG